MIKGAQKKMIVVKTSKSSVFEEAYFVLRRESIASEADMVSEASKIIESGNLKKKSDADDEFKQLAFCFACFACGLATGGCIAALILWI